MEEFRKGKIRILVSSDLAARGLDIPDITHVINMDFPAEPNEYIHRAGRTARGDRQGQCYSIVNPRELAALRIYQREFDIQVAPVHLVKGKILAGAVKEFYKDPDRKKKAQKKSSTPKTDKKPEKKTVKKADSSHKSGSRAGQKREDNKNIRSMQKPTGTKAPSPKRTEKRF